MIFIKFILIKIYKQTIKKSKIKEHYKGMLESQDYCRWKLIKCLISLRNSLFADCHCHSSNLDLKSGSQLALNFCCRHQLCSSCWLLHHRLSYLKQPHLGYIMLYFLIHSRSRDLFCRTISLWSRSVDRIMVHI